jgi:hypothetical protein
MLYTLSKLYIGYLCILDDILGLILGGSNGGILDNDGFGEIVEELVELYKSFLNFLDIIVASADRAEDGRCCARTVGFELPNLLVSE